MSFAMLSALRTRLLDLSERRDARVLVIAGTGPAFSSGHDLKEIVEPEIFAPGKTPAEAYRELFSRCSEVMQMLAVHPLPVIAKVDGVATAAGCQLVASADLAVPPSTRSKAAPPGSGCGWKAVRSGGRARRSRLPPADDGRAAPPILAEADPFPSSGVRSSLASVFRFSRVARCSSRVETATPRRRVRLALPLRAKALAAWIRLFHSLEVVECKQRQRLRLCCVDRAPMMAAISCWPFPEARCEQNSMRVRRASP